MLQVAEISVARQPLLEGPTSDASTLIAGLTLLLLFIKVNLILQKVTRDALLRDMYT